MAAIPSNRIQVGIYPSLHRRNRVVQFALSKQHAERRSIFQTCEPFCDVSMADVEDAIVATKRMCVRDKIEYFGARGIDYDRVCEYVDIVRNLEMTISPARTAYRSWLYVSTTIQNIGVVCAIMFHVCFADNDQRML